MLTFSSRTSFEAFNVASGQSAKASSVISNLVHLTHSLSPIQTIPGDARFPNVYRGSTVKASSVLGFKAKVGVREGLSKFVTAYMRRTGAFLEARIRSSCGPRTGPTSATEITPGETLNDVSPRFAVNNKQLDKLDGCLVHVVMNMDGELATLGPPPESSSSTWTAMKNMPPFEFHTSTSRSHSHDGNESVLIRIQDHDHYVVGLRDPSILGPVVLERMSEWEAKKMSRQKELVADWEMRADTETSTLRLFVPGTKRQLFPTFIGGNFTIVESNTVAGDGPGPFRITPLCCPSPAPWPFVADDRMHLFPSVSAFADACSIHQPSTLRSSIKERHSPFHSSPRPPEPSAVVSNEPCTKSRQK